MAIALQKMASAVDINKVYAVEQFIDSFLMEKKLEDIGRLNDSLVIELPQNLRPDKFEFAILAARYREAGWRDMKLDNGWKASVTLYI